MAAPAQSDCKVRLDLVRAAPDQVLTLRGVLHFLALVLPHLFFVLPVRILLAHTVLRWRSRSVRVLGRPALADFVTKLAQFILSRLPVSQSRIVFNRDRSYKLVHSGPYFKGARDWVTHVEVNGTAGRWIALPGTRRAEDQVVLYFIHGGGFVLDTGANAQDILLHVTKALNLKKSVQASVFCLDYRLAPEYKYPSQLIETLAGYHYLVNTLGISEDKIVIAGDSAGGNLATAFLLHLARPAKEIYVPAELGPTPGRPAGALIISPFVNLASRSTSSFANTPHDFIDLGGGFRAACDYIGITPPPSHRFPAPSLNPKWHLLMPRAHPPVEGEKLHTLHGWAHCEGVELFRSPYVNPVVQRDASWWKEAMPGDGKTVVTWGGKEIFADDDEEFFHRLEKAGVAPTKVFKKFGVHDWILHDWSVPTSWRTRATGPESKFTFGLDAIVSLLSRVAAEAAAAPAQAQSHQEEKPKKGKSATEKGGASAIDAGREGLGAAHESYAQVAGHEGKVDAQAPIVAKGEGDVLHGASIEGSGVLVEKPAANGSA
ncbi:Proteophosphoglycan ppg4 [Rhodotorula diobovata]|uniref:Proteophosphoglycan ppg4 n=1 Tax=Rhodotorula diobovata TaxID=5288 RepID=A0A5C5FS16_9BASI|nr:Proteophosphoglycan ppg4 [Rhodotorula diobovata]